VRGVEDGEREFGLAMLASYDTEGWSILKGFGRLRSGARACARMYIKQCMTDLRIKQAVQSYPSNSPMTQMTMLLFSTETLNETFEHYYLYNKHVIQALNLQSSNPPPSFL
jgi:hypothetical protein